MDFDSIIVQIRFNHCVILDLTAVRWLSDINRGHFLQIDFASG